MATPDPSLDAGSPAVTGLRVPLRMGRICLEKVWGGRALERVPGIELDLPGPVGETWELVDRTDQNSRVSGGPHEGSALRELMATDREALLGEAVPTADGRFPVLVKYLSASKPLSVQVHPDDETARRLHAGESGKTESWYILDAEPGSLVYLGLREGVDISQLGAVAAGRGIVDLLQPWPVSAGQYVHVPAGTLHAIGEGITLVEVQQNSDVTYRLFDWGRVGLDGEPRETHLEQALLAMDYEQPIEGPVTPELENLGGDNRGATLVDGEHYAFAIHEVQSHLDLETPGVARALVVIEGPARLWTAAAEEPWTLEQGDTWLVPAVVEGLRVECPDGVERVRFLLIETKA